MTELYLFFGRAIAVAAPAGIIIWLFATIQIGEASILTYVANFLQPFASLMGLDGYILTAFLLGLPANEIVLPIILMSYIGRGSLVNLEETMAIKEILIQNGWTLLTGINVMIAEDAVSCVALGTGKALDNLDILDGKLRSR